MSWKADADTRRSETFAALWVSHRDSVFAYARRRAPNDAAAEIVTATFAVLWQRLDGPDGGPPEEPLPWLYAVARRELANQRRKESRRSAAIGRLTGEQLTEPQIADLDPAGATVERATAIAALRSLRDVDRELLMLVAWEGLELKQAAVVLGTSEATLAVRLHRARKRLEVELDKLAKEADS